MMNSDNGDFKQQRDLFVGILRLTIYFTTSIDTNEYSSRPDLRVIARGCGLNHVIGRGNRFPNHHRERFQIPRPKICSGNQNILELTYRPAGLHIKPIPQRRSKRSKERSQ
eukprot:scaffold5019_cov131-Skeletonema_dohrnii-CCMP3373.AAC.7